MKTFLVIGLGRFGIAAASKLYEMGYEVMVIDQSEELVNHMADSCTYAAIGDARDMEVLRSMEAGQCDCAIVAMGEDLSASVLITMNLKELGCKYVICKAQNEMYKRALIRIGADRVVIPEREMAVRLVQSLGSGSFHDYIEFSSEYAIAEIDPPKDWIGKTLKQLNVRAKYSVSVLAIQNEAENKMMMSPGAEDVLSAGDTVMIMGRNEDLARFRKL